MAKVSPDSTEAIIRDLILDEVKRGEPRRPSLVVTAVCETLQLDPHDRARSAIVTELWTMVDDGFLTWDTLSASILLGSNQ